MVRTDSDNSDFRELVQQLDAYLAVMDGPDHEFYSQFNTIDKLRNTIVVYGDTGPVGCGAMKPFDTGAMEIKRMFTLPEHRNKGIAAAILTELERWALELGYQKCVLETGKRQPEAIALYTKQGYKTIPNYGQYIGMENSVCFEKKLI